VIPDAVIDEIRGRVDAVAVIGRHMELKKSGRTWSGCCVFHGERTPSFHVYPEDGHWKCYGCGEHGDVFKFLQKLQGKEFPEVVRSLAMEVGVELPEREEDSAEQRRRRAERAELLAACDAAARYYAARLASRYGEAARAYVDSRGFSQETVKQFRLGVASTDWDDLTARLAAKGVAEAALEKAGLVARRASGGGRYDRFRGRLIVPIAAADGEVIGFGGRVLPGAKDERAKYINSSETPLYKKSRVLYGIELAREHIRRSRSAVLVEGYFDVMGLHQAGVRNAVAVCGTALTPEHVEVLRRLDCRTLTLFFDGDAAGVAAATKAAGAVLPSGLMARVALLPADAGKVDPDDFARSRGGAAVEKLIGDAAPLTEYLIERAVAEHCGGAPASASFDQRLAAFRQLRPLIAAVPPGLARTLFEERLARELGTDPAALAEAVDAGPSPAERGAPRSVPPAPRPPRARYAVASAAIDALGLLASFPSLAEAAQDLRFVELFVGVPLEPIARALVEAELTGEQAIVRMEPLLPALALSRVRKLAGEARPDPGSAEREFRKATVEAKIEQQGQEIDRLNAEIVKAGRPVSEELRTAMLVAVRRRADLEKRREALSRG
jgi:DNA primase